MDEKKSNASIDMTMLGCTRTPNNVHRALLVQMSLLALNLGELGESAGEDKRKEVLWVQGIIQNRFDSCIAQMEEILALVDPLTVDDPYQTALAQCLAIRHMLRTLLDKLKSA